MFNFIRGCIVCVLMLLPTAVWASHLLEVEDTSTEGTGNFLFELNGDFIKDGKFKETTLTGTLTAGAGEHIDFSVEVPYLKLNPSPVIDSSASGNGDVRIKMKQRLFENEVNQSMAYQLYLDLPTGDVDKGLGTNNVVWGIMLMDSQGCCNNIFHVNVGYEAFGRDIKKWHYAEDYAFKFGLANEHKLNDSFRFLTEFTGESRKETDRQADTHTYSRPLNFLAGFIYDVSKSWYVDLGMRAGLNKAADDHAVLAKTAWRF